MNERDIEALTRRVEHLEQLVATFASRSEVKDMIRGGFYFPPLTSGRSSESAPFMVHSNCTAEDFRHPRYAQLCKLMYDVPRWHRKQWEYIFILHHLLEANLLKPGRRGLGFGIGREPMPCVFAQLGAHVLATDAPQEILARQGWTQSKEHSASLEQMKLPWIREDLFYQRVSFEECDMNAISPHLKGFDFVWSSCCLEHLGTLRKGLDFIRNSVEHCLRPGGVAVHTTELNLSSDTHTVEASEETVLYRKSDLQAFIEEMKGRGHVVQPLQLAPVESFLDFHVDVPPYSSEPHLRLLLAGFVTTSVGLVIQRAG